MQAELRAVERPICPLSPPRRPGVVLASHMKRPRAATAETAAAAASDAFTALRVARELQEDGDAKAARSCVEHAVGRARDSASVARAPLTFDEASAPLSGAAQPPAALLASAGLATLGALHRASDDLDAARVALEEALAIWPNNAPARVELAELELHHGCAARARALCAAVAALPPLNAPAAPPPAEGAGGDADADSDEGAGGWRAELMEAPRRGAVAVASYLLVLLLHLGGRCDEALPLLRRLGVTLRLSPALWAVNPDSSPNL